MHIFSLKIGNKSKQCRKENPITNSPSDYFCIGALGLPNIFSYTDQVVVNDDTLCEEQVH
jgi:hypothetical protein